MNWIEGEASNWDRREGFVRMNWQRADTVLGLWNCACLSFVGVPENCEQGSEHWVHDTQNARRTGRAELPGAGMAVERTGERLNCSVQAWPAAFASRGGSGDHHEFGAPRCGGCVLCPFWQASWFDVGPWVLVPRRVRYLSVFSARHPTRTETASHSSSPALEHGECAAQLSLPADPPYL